MLKKLFSIEKQDLHYVVRFFGLKIHLRSLKLAYKKIKQLEKNQISPRSAEFLWAAEDKYTLRDKIWKLSQEFYEVVGYYPNIRNPRSFNEKLHWLKLNYYNPQENICIDKYKVKEYIREKLGDGFTIPALGIYDDVNEIDFDSLPEKFVIKSPYDGGGLGMIVVDKSKKIDYDRLKYDINAMMPQWHSLYYRFLSRGYREIEPKILIEEYMPIREGKAIEYKMFCFHGEMKFCLADCDYFGKRPYRALYDKNFELQPFKVGTIKYKPLNEKPANYDKMVELAEKLAADFPHVRVDFYDVNGKVYVGEMSFSSASGFGIFTPREWDFKIGEYLDLNKLNKEYILSSEK